MIETLFMPLARLSKLLPSDDALREVKCGQAMKTHTEVQLPVHRYTWQAMTGCDSLIRDNLEDRFSFLRWWEILVEFQEHRGTSGAGRADRDVAGRG